MCVFFSKFQWEHLQSYLERISFTLQNHYQQTSTVSCSDLDETETSVGFITHIVGFNSINLKHSANSILANIHKLNVWHHVLISAPLVWICADTVCVMKAYECNVVSKLHEYLNIGLSVICSLCSTRYWAQSRSCPPSLVAVSLCSLGLSSCTALSATLRYENTLDKQKINCHQTRSVLVSCYKKKIFSPDHQHSITLPVGRNIDQKY